VSRFNVAVVALAAAIPVGGIGAWAFNPDSGVVLHSSALWRIFGITFEVGLPLLLVVLIVSALRGVLRNRHVRKVL
jgi:hypothetical protein